VWRREVSIPQLTHISLPHGLHRLWCIESQKLTLNTEITEKVTEITNEMTEITSVYVRLYVSESHTKFHKDWCSFEKVMAIKLNL
jgi:hypothetical protein